MIRRPPRATVTKARLPYTTLFRSACELGDDAIGGEGRRIAGGVDILDDAAVSPALLGRVESRIGVTVELLERARAARLDGADAGGPRRSEEGRVGKECVSTHTARRSPSTEKKTSNLTPTSLMQYNQYLVTHLIFINIHIDIEC